MSKKDVPIPERMQHLPRDKRGYPIPFVVLIDATGTPHFTVNDGLKQWECVQQNLCHICGQEIEGTAWFVGGPLSAFHEHGSYIDGPSHSECVHYALLVCPYLAAPSYRNRLEDATLRHVGKEAFSGVVLVDNTMLSDRPVLFVALETDGESISHNGTSLLHKPNRPYLQVEFWHWGEQSPHDEGAAIVCEELGKAVPTPKEPVIRHIK